MIVRRGSRPFFFVMGACLAVVLLWLVPPPRPVLAQPHSIGEIYDSLKRLTDEKRFGDALPRAQAALQEHPGEEGFAAYTLWCLREMKRFDEALALGRRAMKEWSASENIRANMAWVLTLYAAHIVENKIERDPLPYAREGYALLPNDGTALWLGISLRHRGQLEEAARVLADGMAKYPANKYFRGNLVNTVLEQGQKARDAKDSKTADALFAKSYTLDPANEGALLWYAIAQREKKNYVEANRLFADGLRLFPKNRYFAENLRWSVVEQAMALTERDEVTQARAILTGARKSFPDDPFILSALAFTYFRRDHDRWAALSRESLALVPRDKLKALHVYQCPLRAPRMMIHQGAMEPVTHLGIGNGYAWDLVLVDEQNAYGPVWDRKEAHLIFNEPVYAALDGTVTRVFDASPDTEPGHNGPYEVNHIIIEHEGGEISYYAHLKKGSAQVKQGDRVRQGQRIALVGSSGRYVDFPHLHFQVMRDNLCVEAMMTGIEIMVDAAWRKSGPLVPKKRDILRAAW